MTNTKTGWITREWIVETVPPGAVVYAAGGAAFSSAHLTQVDEAVFLGGFGTVVENQPTFATVVAHGRSFPDQGTVGGTVAATLEPQQWKAGLYNLSGAAGTLVGAEIGAGTLGPTLWALRGR